MINEELKTHYLKTWPEYFSDLKKGLKDFEVRYNDREFNVGDDVICQEYNPTTKQYSGHTLLFKIKYIASWNDNTIMGLALKVGYSVLGLERYSPTEPD